MKVLVCGGRAYHDKEAVFRALDNLHTGHARPITRVIQGGGTGADALGARWATLRGIEVQEFRAEWATDGPSAGPRRNQRMLDVARPDLVVAFPGGRGTADMVRRARRARVIVLEPAP